MVVTSLIGATDNIILKLVTIAILFVNIVCKYYLFISLSFEYTVYFIVMVYCIAFGCNSIIVVDCTSENISFFRFPAT